MVEEERARETSLERMTEAGRRIFGAVLASR